MHITLRSDLDQGNGEPTRLNQWKLGDILNSLIAVGLTVERFEEHPNHYSDQMPQLAAEIAS